MKVTIKFRLRGYEIKHLLFVFQTHLTSDEAKRKQLCEDTPG